MRARMMSLRDGVVGLAWTGTLYVERLNWMDMVTGGLLDLGVGLH